MSNTFAQFDLDQGLIQSLLKHNFVNPTPIQLEVIPLILEGKDVLAQAETGSGKTGAFMIPLLHLAKQKSLSVGHEKNKEINNRNVSVPLYVILSPTRELAQQITTVADQFGTPMGVKTLCVIGGESIFEQKKTAQEGIDILVATPGRLTDLFKQNIISFENCEGVVLDEVDRLFDMGFKDEIHFILSKIPKVRQLLMFTATHNLEVLNMAYRFRADPVEIRLNEDSILVDHIQHSLRHLGDGEKMPFLVGLLRQNPESYVIIFSNTQKQTHLVARWLDELGFKVKGISGSLPQSKRSKLMEQFRQKEIHILVSTDVAARGLDIKDVNLVINYDLPSDPSNYVHRIGRTGRAGKDGRAISFCAYRDCEFLGPIEDYIKGKIPVEEIDEKQLAADIGQAPLDADESNESIGNTRAGSESRRDSYNRDDYRRRPSPRRNNSERGRQTRAGGQRNFRDQGNREGRSDYRDRDGRSRNSNRNAGPRSDRYSSDRYNNSRRGNSEFGNRNGPSSRRRRFEGPESDRDLRPKRRIFETTTTNIKAAEDEAIKFFRLDDDSLLGHRVMEEGKRKFFGLGPKEVRVEFFVKPDFEVLLSTYLERLFKLMNVQITADVTYVPPLATVNLEGAEEVLLGENDGELLASIDHIVKKYLGKLLDLAPDFKLRIQSEGLLRDKEKKLQDLTDKMKAKVLETGKAVILDPLSPSDRRLVHQFLDQDDDVTTRSLGHGHFKRIKIELVNPSNQDDEEYESHHEEDSDSDSDYESHEESNNGDEDLDEDGRGNAGNDYN